MSGGWYPEPEDAVRIPPGGTKRPACQEWIARALAAEAALATERERSDSYARAVAAFSDRAEVAHAALAIEREARERAEGERDAAYEDAQNAQAIEANTWREEYDTIKARAERAEAERDTWRDTRCTCNEARERAEAAERRLSDLRVDAESGDHWREQYRLVVARAERLEEALREIEVLSFRQYADWMHFHELAMAKPFEAESEAQDFARCVSSLATIALGEASGIEVVGLTPQPDEERA